jgi:hypothetical protein
MVGSGRIGLGLGGFAWIPPLNNARSRKTARKGLDLNGLALEGFYADGYGHEVDFRHR